MLSVKILNTKAAMPAYQHCSWTRCTRYVPADVLHAMHCSRIRSIVLKRGTRERQQRGHINNGVYVVCKQDSVCARRLCPCK